MIIVHLLLPKYINTHPKDVIENSKERNGYIKKLEFPEGLGGSDQNTMGGMSMVWNYFETTNGRNFLENQNKAYQIINL